ncbi:predicted protein [Plenodomus lingam JN3]|uniref:tRNA (adenine(58)-N(1))-methyltransferase non-catalytic subunit TRM6 n=1 Tax=Leptosphaeria maculans (strain JN3 / isolate v23.1.3 / race Av1-4-5-6-7-8) TaxID=985895 RepID=E5ABU2_LEPMJ|nr:predicted protein [Plenodomus lingam JN3]CBY01133.1 predicted protein [Plenodomus lingam JN3]
MLNPSSNSATTTPRIVAPPSSLANSDCRPHLRAADADEHSEETEPDDDEDFPLNPTLLLAPTLQTARARHWQVLPSRTHPLMTSRGGAEGYVFSATRVLPVEGRVEARGQHGKKKRKVDVEAEGDAGM